MTPIRVLVVDDSAAVRCVLRRLVDEDPELEMAGVAANGRIALAMVEQTAPDLVTLDLAMPEMDGLSTLGHLRKTHPDLPVLIFSSAAERGATATVDALLHGATHYFAKPVSDRGPEQAVSLLRQQLLPKIKTLCGRRTANRLHSSGGKSGGYSPVGIIVIGASTGGPNALSAVLKTFPASLPVPVLVVQHMPRPFPRLLAERLNAVCALPVQEAKRGETLCPGEVRIAPGGSHLVISDQSGTPQLRLWNTPPENSCRPSVDVLFRSAAEVFGARTMAVVLTGMGQDGLRGAREVVAAGGRVWAQDEATSVVWGMPGFIAQNGLAERILPLTVIGPELVRAVCEGRTMPAIGKGREAFDSYIPSPGAACS